MAAWKCGWCGKHAQMNIAGSGHAISRNPANRYKTGQHDADLYGAMRCSNCSGLSVVRTLYPISVTRSEETIVEVAEFWRHNAPEDWAPKWIEGQDFNFAPSHIAAVASEAHRCSSIGANMAAILMARTAIEAAAKDKGITSGNLVKKIEELATQGFIRKTIKDAADKVRMFGNDMAHGDVQVEVTENDAAQVLRLLTFILQDLYQVQVLMDEVGVSLDGRKAK